MGCCEVHDQAATLTPQRNCPSILKLNKKPSREKKTVTFDSTLSNFKELNIKEASESEILWYSPILSINDLGWEIYHINHSIKIIYIVEGDFIMTHTTINLNLKFGFEAVISLINNPKHRIRWDNEISKIELLFGDLNLDATLSIFESSVNQVKLFERIVRRYKELYLISYVYFEDANKTEYMLIVISAGKKIKIFYRENTHEIYGKLTRKLSWAIRLLDEIHSYYKQRQ